MFPVNQNPKAKTWTNFNKKHYNSSLKKKEILGAGGLHPDEQHDILSITDRISQNWAMKNQSFNIDETDKTGS